MDEQPDIGMELSRKLKGNVLLIGVGNTLRGDDGAGPMLIELLEGKVEASLLDAGETPESYVGRILETRADTIVWVDAADFGGSPGDIALLDSEAVVLGSVSTHQIPMDVFFHYIKANSSADMFAIGIQPAGIEFGEPMNAAVAESVENLAVLLQDLLPLA
jgi:hydrogenase 3 maturation protease